MFRQIFTLAVVGGFTIGSASSEAMGQIGEPIGSFGITVKQGGSTIASRTVTVGPGGDLTDLKPIWVDGDPESFTQIGTIGPASPIILKLVSDGGPIESMRILRWYIDVPVSLSNINTPGPYSLFNPSGGYIEVSVTSLEFNNGVAAIPQLDNSSYFNASFMRDHEGYYYETSLSNPFNYAGHGMSDIQVPGVRYLDSDPTKYTFGNTLGTSCSCTWGNIVNPGLTTTVGNGTGGGQAPLVPGYVFELGTVVAFTAMPGPDCDGDGVLNEIDECPCNKPGLVVDSEGRPKLDMNNDCNVDGPDMQLIVQELLK